MRYTVYARSPFKWEVQLAATDPGDMLRVLAATDNLASATFAATCWATWLNDYGLVFDTVTKQWAKVIPPANLLPLPGIAIAQNVVYPAGLSRPPPPPI